MTISNKTRRGADAETGSELKGFQKKVPFIPVIILLVIAGLVFSFIFLDFSTDSGRTDSSCSESNMYIAQRNVQLLASSKRTYDLEFATNPSQQEMGLSLRPCIPSYTALVFLFPTDSTFGIWMKDMKFPIDVIWLDKDKKVVTIVPNMVPDSYPKIFYPARDSRYAIEMAAGQVSQLGVKEGDTLQWRD